jgi:flagella basal body P-ring formation protein FlgA
LPPFGGLRHAETSRGGLGHQTVTSWLNVRTVLGALLFLIALVSGWVVLGEAHPTTTVWAAARDLSEGAVVGKGDLVAVRAQLPQSTLSVYLATSSELEGATVLRSVSRGELIPAAGLEAATVPRTTRAAEPLK